MGQLLDTITQFFAGEGWPYTAIEGQSALRLIYQDQVGQLICYAQAREEQAQLVFYSVCATKTPEAKREAMAELLTRANYGLAVGNFEMDFGDGAVRYKTSAYIGSAGLHTDILRGLVYLNITTMNRYMPALMALLFSDASPTQAIAQVEAAGGKA